MRNAAILASLLILSAPGFGQTATDGWPRWRGPTGNGYNPKAKPPTKWSESKNVRWKVPLPGEGHASPIVLGDRIYLLTAIKTDKTEARGAASEDVLANARDVSDVSGFFAQEAKPGVEISPRPGGQQREQRRQGGGNPFGGKEAPKNIYHFDVLSIDRKTGKTVWQKTVKEARPHEAIHPDATQVSNSPVTDGKFIYAFFGSRGLYCLDLDGNVKWERDLGQMHTRNEFGEGASCSVYGETVIVNWDHEGDDFIAAFDRTTGNEIWRKPRNESTTWATPYIVAVGDNPQVVVEGAKSCISYDLKTGETVWECGGLTANPIPSPVCEDGLMILMSGFRGAAIKAVKLADAKGKLEDNSPAMVWTNEPDVKTPYVSSPLLADGQLYFFDNNTPRLTCLDARTGKKLFGPERIEGLNTIYSSPVASAENVYLFARNGKAVVLARGPEYKLVATNELEDEFDASPALVDGEMILRGRKSLYCIEAN